ncbi:MAG: ABC transporter ATP-binding protein [Clostridium sp.]|uniref:ABC transporter ATP-binding protein n=1 Tax=Clostridium sp. DSM 8431 TaxID=1761781 RepID=UPI0008EF6B50|nr:ABC transporter ATP-binding protein [Clostridium sp. DSM 8431]MCR4943360.1 ABC transporter ATP-binding protein [Clostridium sp.]SFU41440.1 energy-coupling factor transport system ATP-binding protein [Clostridium sp. DSM 8431]
MITLKDISFSYPGRGDAGLKSINLEIKKGECILLCGRSGCGKTTITRLINKLIPYFYEGNLDGTVLVDNINSKSAEMYSISEKVGSVFQNPRTQFFNVDTDSEIAFGIENEALPEEKLRERVDKTINDLQIQKLKGRNIFKLSGGEKQKIAFASVYAMNPDVYLLDEPSSNLDMAAINDLKKYLAFIKGQGKTIIIAEHRLYYLLDLADRIIYLKDGKIDKIYNSKNFRAIPNKLRKEMGLRAVELKSVHPVKDSFKVNKPVLEIKDVTLRHDKKAILKNINVSVGKGEVVAVVGSNGAGKTTFSRTLCGLHKEYTGDFFYKGKKCTNKERLKECYMVMQDVNYELFAESVEVEMSFGIKNPDKDLIEKTMDELGILPYRKYHPNTLSGGQKQRIAVGVSMISGKEILVFDEPTSGLDYDGMIKVSKLINELSEKGKIIFIVTHDYEFVCNTCSRVIRFHEGTLKDNLLVTKENEDKLYQIFSIDN